MKKALVIGILALCVAGAALYIYKGIGSGQSIAFNVPNGQGTTTELADPTSLPLAVATPTTIDAGGGNRLYSSREFHFSIAYPQNLVAKEYKEQNGALTASFQDPTTNQGFEIYVTPYSGTQIDEARFKLDEPSGTFLNPTDVMIAGEHATKFNGKNAVMGDTSEVWFIRGGYLYEVATYKELDSWLGTIMQSFAFI